MTKGVMKFVKGAGAGMAVGMVVGSVGSSIMRGNKKIKKRASKAVKAVGDVIENVQGMIK